MLEMGSADRGWAGAVTVSTCFVLALRRGNDPTQGLRQSSHFWIRGVRLPSPFLGQLHIARVREDIDVAAVESPMRVAEAQELRSGPSGPFWGAFGGGERWRLVISRE